MRFLFALVAVSFFAQAAASQCCCSGAEVTLTNGAGFPLRVSDVKVEEITPSRPYSRLLRVNSESDETRYSFKVGCGTGRETLLIEQMGVQMRVRFKLYGEFGSPRIEIAFTPGDHVAEMSEQRDDGTARTIALRPATETEMKEIEPPADSDAPSDQTANAS